MTFQYGSDKGKKQFLAARCGLTNANKYSNVKHNDEEKKGFNFNIKLCLLKINIDRETTCSGSVAEMVPHQRRMVEKKIETTVSVSFYKFFFPLAVTGTTTFSAQRLAQAASFCF